GFRLHCLGWSKSAQHNFLEKVMFRLDRLASIYLWGPIARAMAGNSSLRVPILMYHSVSDNLFGKTHPYFQINTLPKVFFEQMQFLHDAGYVTVDLQDVVVGRRQPKEHEKLLVITFDDGYRDFYTHAFQILHRFGLTATVFLTSGRIHQ